MRGKYDIGAKIIRKSSRPATTKNSDLEHVKEFNKTMADPKSGALLGTSYTGRKDFAEMSAQEDFTDEIYLNDDPI
jgi:hypothetical protein